jgi:hypothetical protein
MYPTHPYAPWCIPESWHVRTCVHDLGGRRSDGPCMAGTVRKGVDSVRRRQVAAPSGPAAGTPMPRLPPAPQPAQAIACGSAFRSSAHEAGRRPLLSGTAACSAVTVLQLYPTLTCHTTRLLMARMQSLETRTMHHAACDTHVQPAMRSKLRADDAPDGTEGYPRGTQGY